MSANRPMNNGSVDVTPPSNGALNDPDQVLNTILITAGGKVTSAGVINALYGCTASKDSTGVYEVVVPYDSEIYTFAVASICADRPFTIVFYGFKAA